MNQDTIKEAIKELAEKLTVKVDDISMTEDSVNGHLTCTIRTAESGLLIGSNGLVFSALSHVARKLVAKKLGIEEKESSRFSININDYREKSRTDLEQKARIMADRAVSFKCDIEMDPMTSYERMCVHSYLKGYKDIKTESLGEGRERRVVIKYSSSDKEDLGLET